MAEVPGMSSQQRWTLVLVCTAVFMLLLDVTVVSVALPSIQRELHASLPDLQWVSAAYALVLAVLLLPAATLGDRLGRRRLFLVGLVIWGQRDRYLGPELAEPEHDDVPNLDHVERLDDASHWVHHDESERVTQLLIDFFAPALPAKN